MDDKKEIKLDLSKVSGATLAFLYMDTIKGFSYKKDGRDYWGFKDDPDYDELREQIKQYVETLPADQKQRFEWDITNIQHLGCICGN